MQQHNKYMKQAFDISKNSPDPSTKVGAVLVSPDEKHIFTGFNAFPAGIPNKEEWWNNRDSSGKEFSKYDLACCAELMAILKATKPLEGYSIYSTHYPCLSCARVITAVGIKKVYYALSTEHIKKKIDKNKVSGLFNLANIEFTQIMQ